MDWLVKMGCENVIELDWWEENCVPGHDDITFVCTPAQHWSKRTALDDNKVTVARWRALMKAPSHTSSTGEVVSCTDDLRLFCVPQSLWGSWSILGPDHRFFFAGDTGYCSTFQEIGRRFGPFDLAAIPIGAYHPRLPVHLSPNFCVLLFRVWAPFLFFVVHWSSSSLKKVPLHNIVPLSPFRDMMQGQHVDPEEAVQIHLDLQAKESVAIHWGTFALAYEVWLSFRNVTFFSHFMSNLIVVNAFVFCCKFSESSNSISPI